MTESGTADGADDDAYSGLLGSIPYAIRSSESLLFRSYGILGGLLAGLVAFLFTLSLIGVAASTMQSGSGVFSFSRAFIIFVGMLVVFPLLAPILSVARRHRRAESTVRYDKTFGLAGYLFIVSLYLALVISTPAQQQEQVSGIIAPVVQFFYALPRLAGLVPPTVVALCMYVIHRNGQKAPEHTG